MFVNLRIGGILLPLSHRQKVNHGGILTIQSVQRAADEGEYSCVVRGMDGQTASGTTYVTVVGKYIKRDKTMHIIIFILSGRIVSRFLFIMQ